MMFKSTSAALMSCTLLASCVGVRAYKSDQPNLQALADNILREINDARAEKGASDEHFNVVPVRNIAHVSLIGPIEPNIENARLVGLKEQAAKLTSAIEKGKKEDKSKNNFGAQLRLDRL